VRGGRAGAVVVACIAAALPSTGGVAAPTAVSGWLTYGNGVTRTGIAARPVGAHALQQAWFSPIEGRITSQALVARDTPAAGTFTIYAATSAGRVYAFAPNGYVRWQADLGQLAHECTQLAGWGVTGTGAIDPLGGVLYVADAFGRLHALDLRTGAERSDWPVRLFDDPEREHVWGALTLVGRDLYVPTGAYCDAGPMQGKVIRVALESRTVSSWAAVPDSLGGGGGIWGWGGLAYSARQDALFAVTGNAFRGGQNDGPAFRESAGYGEHLVELSRDLTLRAASHPENVREELDLDFVGSPVVFERQGCGELVVALNKNGTLYAWRTAAVADGPLWQVELQQLDPTQPVLTQPAYSARHGAIFVSTFTGLIRVSLDRECKPAVGWAYPFGVETLHGSPTVSGDFVWTVVSSAPPALLAVDARTGKLRSRLFLGGATFAAPTIVDGRIFLGEMHGMTGAVPVRRTSGASAVPGHSSWSDPQHGWESRESGVYSTDDGGKTWRRILPLYATSLVRTSARAGVVAIGYPASSCHCRTTQYVTADGGAHWRAASAVGEDFTGRGDQLYWWRAGTLQHVMRWPAGASSTLGSKTVARVDDGRIVDAVPIPTGVAAAVTGRRGGAGWDTTPRVLLYADGEGRLATLPERPGSLLVQSISATWPVLTVTALDFDTDRPTRVVWRSADGGNTWALAEG
jgi:hypothetical protein